MEIREYNRIVEYNPAVSSSIAVGLDWTLYGPPVTHTVEDHQNLGYQGRKRRWARGEVVWLRPARRYALLEEFGVSTEEIREAKKHIIKVRAELSFV